ncbi:MAG: dTMP kinase [Pseudomonadales bacterium]|nr:dTMP kinase [Pseudomonadales bacterium]
MTTIQRRGQFITIEGGEGVGKSTNIACIESFLQQQAIAYIKTREPGGTPLAEELRQLLLSPREETVSEKTELLLMFAARAQHLQQVILPALQQGLWVVCDRFTDATYAYQGGGRGLSIEMIAALEALVQEGLQPDLTLLLDVDVSTGLSRLQNRDTIDRFERDEQQFFESVRAMYRQRAQQFPERFRIIDAGQALADVQQDIITTLRAFIHRVSGA